MGNFLGILYVGNTSYVFVIVMERRWKRYYQNVKPIYTRTGTGKYECHYVSLHRINYLLLSGAGFDL